jgi:hypothetical protein
MELERFIGIGQSLGYTGEELRKYAEGLWTQAIEREERLSRRQAEREREEAERKREQAEWERDREREQADIAAKAELEKQKTLELQIQLKATSGGATSSSGGRTSRPKLPRFDEQSDDMDAFLARFETFAKCQKWDPSEWAVDLSALLTGKGLQVYNNMPSDQVNNYDELKVALLQRYELTEDSFRRIRESRPSKGENVFQFGARLKRFFDRWTQLAKIEDKYDDLRDLLIREQFLEACQPDLAVFLRERRPKTFDEMSTIAQRYVDAHGSSLMGNKFGKKDFNQPSKKQSFQSNQSGDQNKPDTRFNTPKQKSEEECFFCHKKCRAKQTQAKKVVGAVKDTLGRRMKMGAKSSQ